MVREYNYNRVGFVAALLLSVTVGLTSFLDQPTPLVVEQLDIWFKCVIISGVIEFFYVNHKREPK